MVTLLRRAKRKALSLKTLPTKLCVEKITLCGKVWTIKPSQKCHSPVEFTDNNLLRISGPDLKGLQQALGQQKIKVKKQA